VSISHKTILHKIHHVIHILPLFQEAPPLIPALRCGKYHIKWKKLTNLSAPLYNAYAVMQQNRIYVAGGYSPVDIAMQTVYVYELHTDCWKQLPLLDHYCAVAHIIGGRLTLIGGRLCSSNESTNKVSTFDESTHTWTSYYPDLLSARYRPGVVAYLDHVIVAG